MSSQLFSQFRKNLEVSNSDEISTSYREITKRLNSDYWDLESEDQRNCLQVGSYGRHTAIRGVSDLDMVFELPESEFNRFRKVQGNGPSQLLQEVRTCLKKRYPDSDIRAAQQVVQVHFSKYRVEVLPAFRQEDGRYRYGDANDGGSWDNFCDPRAEISAVNTRNAASNRNLKRICKMVRAWKNRCGAPMSGMLIDTLVYNFFGVNKSYDGKSYGVYDELVRDVFSFLANQEEQAFWRAPGSASEVKNNGNFQRKAKKAAAKCQEAIEVKEEKRKSQLWREVFGNRFPKSDSSSSKSIREGGGYSRTEEFIEDKFPVDVQYQVEIECEVGFSGSQELRYRFLESKFSWLKLGRNLSFRIVGCNVPGEYKVYWKVRNVGALAESRNQIRGQIVADKGNERISEKTSFGGEHFVECYIVQDGVCVAREALPVPIEI